MAEERPQHPYIYEDEEDEEDQGLPFAYVDKATALQDCRVFDHVPLKEEACIQAITQLLYLISTDAELTTSEASDIFFMSTKVAQSQNPKLCRMQHLLMKELGPKVDQRFIAANSVMAQIKNGDDAMKSNAIRTLYAVLDSSMYSMMDRFIGESINSNNPAVVTAAIVSGYHIAQTNPDVAKRWIPQLSELLRGLGRSQYAAIALLHRIRRNDRLSASRLMEQVRNRQIYSPLAVCLVIKVCHEMMKDDLSASMELYGFVVSMVNHTDYLPSMEAMRCLCSLRSINDEMLRPVILAMSHGLSSGTSVYQFFIMRQLSQLSIAHGAAIEPILRDVECAVANSNRVIAALAITIVLRIGTSESVDRMIATSLSNTLVDFPEELRLIIVHALGTRCAQHPGKEDALLVFLLKILREEGGCPLKQAVVRTMMELMSANPATKEVVLAHLAEFIDDCEFPRITMDVLSLFGEEVPSSANPRKYIRYIYNHATLEQADVRTVAVTTLAKIASRTPSLRGSVRQLLRRCCGDPDDDVRDRARLYANLFAAKDDGLITSLIDDVASTVHQRQHRLTRNMAASRMAKKDGMHHLHAAADAVVAAAATADAGGSHAHTSTSAAKMMSSATTTSPAVLQGVDALGRIPQLRSFGELLRTVEPLPITETDSEYVVSVMKHIYAEHLVLQFKVKNTMEDVSFRNVSVVLNTEELEEAEPLFAIPIARIKPGETQFGYVVLRFVPHNYPSGSIESKFRFSMMEVAEDDDVADGADAPHDLDVEEYDMEAFDVHVSDFVLPMTSWSSSKMEEEWAAMAAEETSGTYALRSMRNLSVAAQEVADFFGMHLAEPLPERITTTSHTIFMCGAVADAHKTVLMVQARLFVASDSSVALHLALRGGDEELREGMAEALLG